MAIRTENFEINGVQFVRTWSDENRYVVGGNPYGEYEEGLDPADQHRKYIEGEPMPREYVDAQAILNILLGGDSE